MSFRQRHPQAFRHHVGISDLRGKSQQPGRGLGVEYRLREGAPVLRQYFQILPGCVQYLDARGVCQKLMQGGEIGKRQRIDQHADVIGCRLHQA